MESGTRELQQVLSQFQAELKSGMSRTTVAKYQTTGEKQEKTKPTEKN
jgi:hypothetical protein